ncbi:nmrA family transcriptional regulator [Aspergillus heteromorphus CBS 117.55]|uniref:NmrA family transcriptional regulator n=1 Tax=Aspergillus heteromorphus CBS 117.55 TaxID=1448321 RepID=A0A317W9Y5_9EURO|nr:nmrA family transcriptional regulator [Aspergillus heteromorphus CBS 117.55]PWY82132.1 nmrA family transcriptional regulator [Aspergillus heteromorphus CBS 117.55]
MTTDTKILVVFGATGKQGGSVAQTMLKDPVASAQFTIRAVTRDPSKPAALALAQQGAEIVKADMEDKDSLRLAFSNAYAVYALTNFMESFDAAAETRQGKNVADVAKELDVKHLVWSSLPHVSKLSNNKFTGVVHFDGKAYVDEYIRSLSIPYTIIHVAVYTSVVCEQLALLPTTPPSYGLFFPEPATVNTNIPLIDPSADLGKFVKGILLNPEASLGQQFNIGEKFYTVQEIIDAAKNLGVEISFKTLDRDIYKAGLAEQALPEFFQEDMTQMVQFLSEYGFFGGAGIEEAKKFLTGPLVTLEESLKSNPSFAALQKA